MPQVPVPQCHCGRDLFFSGSLRTFKGEPRGLSMLYQANKLLAPIHRWRHGQSPKCSLIDRIPNEHRGSPRSGAAAQIPAVIGSTAEYQNHDVGAVLGMAICKQERKHCSAGDVVLFCLFTKLLLPLFGENFVPIRSIKGRSSGVQDSRRGQGIGYHQSTTQSQLTYPTSLSVSPLVYHRPVRSRCRGIPLCTYECPFGPGGSCGIELSNTVADILDMASTHHASESLS